MRYNLYRHLKKAREKKSKFCDIPQTFGCDTSWCGSSVSIQIFLKVVQFFFSSIPFVYTLTKLSHCSFMIIYSIADSLSQIRTPFLASISQIHTPFSKCICLFHKFTTFQQLSVSHKLTALLQVDIAFSQSVIVLSRIFQVVAHLSYVTYSHKHSLASRMHTHKTRNPLQCSQIFVFKRSHDTILLLTFPATFL